MYSKIELYCRFNHFTETGYVSLFYNRNFDNFICKKISKVRNGDSLGNFIKEYLGLNLTWYIDEKLYNKLIT